MKLIQILDACLMRFAEKYGDYLYYGIIIVAAITACMGMMGRLE